MDALVASQTYAETNNGGAMVNPNGPEIPGVVESLFQHTLGHLPSAATLGAFAGMTNAQAFEAFATSSTVTNVVGSAVANFINSHYVG